MRKRFVVLAGLAFAGLALGAGIWAAQPCRPLDRLFGWSGCLGSIEIADLAALRRTLAFDPKRPDLLYAAGVAYQGYQSRDRLRGRGTLVALAFPGGAELWRKPVEPNGMPETLVVSPDGSRAALTCNRMTTCDFAPNLAAGADRESVTPLAVIDLARAQAARDAGETARAQWMRPVALSAIPVDADGRSAEPRFSVDGASVSAGGASWTLAGDPAPAASETAPRSGGWDAASLPGAGGSVLYERRSASLVLRDAAGAELTRMALELPEDFETALHTPLAVSPDAARVAVLNRRFSGPGETRAFLQVFRIADGTRLVRVAIEDELSPALLFSPDGKRLLVATAPEAEPRASTTVRLYPAGISE